MATANGASVGINTPPQVSFKTIKNTLADFKAKGVLPPRIDRRFFSTSSNTVANQTVAALKFLDLIDEVGVPTMMLEVLTSSDLSDEDWRLALGGVIRSAYAPVMDVELDKVHGSHLRDKFKAAFDLEGDPQRKAIAFFLFAAREAGMKLSPYLKLRERRASVGQRKKRERIPAGEVTKPNPESGGASLPPPPKARKVHEHQMALVEIINTYSDMSDDMRKALLDVVGFIATKGVP